MGNDRQTEPELKRCGPTRVRDRCINASVTCDPRQNENRYAWTWRGSIRSTEKRSHFEARKVLRVRHSPPVYDGDVKWGQRLPNSWSVPSPRCSNKYDTLQAYWSLQLQLHVVLWHARACACSHHSSIVHCLHPVTSCKAQVCLRSKISWASEREISCEFDHTESSERSEMPVRALANCSHHSSIVHWLHPVTSCQGAGVPSIKDQLGIWERDQWSHRKFWKKRDAASWFWEILFPFAGAPAKCRRNGQFRRTLTAIRVGQTAKVLKIRSSFGPVCGIYNGAQMGNDRQTEPELKRCGPTRVRDRCINASVTCDPRQN